MPSRFEIKGRDEFLQALRELPEQLRAEGINLVKGRANGAQVNIKTAYLEHKVTGNLAAHVKVDIEESAVGIVANVKSTAKHAFIFEHGTMVRKNKKGANRGSMPAGNIYIPAMVRARRLLTDDLMGLLERAGLVVRRV